MAARLLFPTNPGVFRFRRTAPSRPRLREKGLSPENIGQLLGAAKMGASLLSDAGDLATQVAYRSDSTPSPVQQQAAAKALGTTVPQQAQEASMQPRSGLDETPAYGRTTTDRLWYEPDQHVFAEGIMGPAEHHRGLRRGMETVRTPIVGQAAPEDQPPAPPLLVTPSGQPTITVQPTQQQGFVPQQVSFPMPAMQGLQPQQFTQSASPAHPAAPQAQPAFQPEVQGQTAQDYADRQRTLAAQAAPQQQAPVQPIPTGPNGTYVYGVDVPWPKMGTHQELLNAATIAKQTGNTELAAKVLERFGTGAHLQDVQPEGWRDLFDDGHLKRAGDKLRKTLAWNAPKEKKVDPLLGIKGANIQSQIRRREGQEKRDQEAQQGKLDAQQAAKELAAIKLKRQRRQYQGDEYTVEVERWKAKYAPEAQKEAVNLLKGRTSMARGQGRRARAQAAGQEDFNRRGGQKARVERLEYRPPRGPLVVFNPAPVKAKAKINRAEKIRAEIRALQDKINTASAWANSSIPSWINLSRLHQMDPSRAEATVQKAIDKQLFATQEGKAAAATLVQKFKDLAEAEGTTKEDIAAKMKAAKAAYDRATGGNP